MPKYALGTDVLTAAQERIGWTFDNFPRIYYARYEALMAKRRAAWGIFVPD